MTPADGPIARPGAGEIHRARPRSVYEAVGGREFFDELTGRFYDAVAADAVLRPLYPEDLGPPREHLALFLKQYWGGPPDYHLQRGQPALRMRHAPFAIGVAERDAWLAHMTAAVHDTVAAADLDDDVSRDVTAALLDYFTKAAAFLMNR